VSVDSLIPGTTLQRGTPWLAMTRPLPEPRLAQDDHRQVKARGGAGRLAAKVLSSLVH
jgi:hypothetical protein